MTARKLKPYPKYKDSGIESLGKIPAQWNVRRLKTIASVQLSNVDKKSVEGEEPVRLCNYTDVYYHDRITADLDFMQATATPDQVCRFALKKGDVLITKDSESWTDIAVPAVVAEDLPGVLCGYHLSHIRPYQGCHGPFLARAFSAIGPRDQFQIAANGITRFGLGGDAIAASTFAIPSETEQRAIAAFLDRETARIDDLVAKKERLIELLQEERTAAITRAVTKGLDPDIAMKGSGIEWLGEIPAHWGIKPLKRLLSGYDYGISDNLSEGGGIRVLTMAHIQDGEVKLPHQGAVNDVDDSLLLRSNDLVFNRTNSRELVGKVGLFRGSLEDRVTFASYLVRLTARTGLDAEWLNYLLNSDGVLGVSRSMALLSVNQANLNPTKYTQIAVPCPPEAEQRAIATFLNREAARIQAVISRIRRAIERLKELRTAVISAAVTGKIDVREDAV